MAYPTTIPVRLFKQGEFAVINGKKYVPERTCRISQHRCTNCDHEINDRAYFEKVALDDGCWTAESRTANYCPNCGARVKEDTDAD